ncbi:extracellular solute-binding protein [Nocardia spumae]|uniref:extracellular solute-binding protein n=1 Tax=Nocardia spumae TaxID=2887190 RepID=UPI001D15A0C9|nr:extracellular solute-binding protein [Nocardia spumae]
MTGAPRGVCAVLALLTAVTLLVAGCGFRGRSSDDSNPNALSLLVPAYSDSTRAEWMSIIARFREQNPAITIDLQVESWDAINEVVRTDLQSVGTTPDILNIDAYAGFAADDLLYPVGDIVDRSVLNDLVPAFARNASIDGTQWALPIFASTRTLFYNTDLFARAGVTAAPRTWSELTDAARRVQALGGGISGYGLPLGSEEAQGETSIWTFGAGGSWSGDHGVTVATAPNLEGVEAMRSLADAGVTQPNPGSTDRKDVINAFIQGRIGMIEGLPPVLETIARQNPGLRLGTAPSPTKTGAPVTLGVADHLLAFRKHGNKRDAIRQFLDYFYSPAVYSSFVGAEHFIPITASGTRALADDPVTRAFAPTVAAARFYPSGDPAWAAVQGAVRQQIGTVTQGADPRQVLDRIARAAR